MRWFPILLLGCAGVFEPSAPWETFDPPPSYQVWHHEVETCVHARRSFHDIVWRKVYAEEFSCGAFDGAVGCYSKPHTITLVEERLDQDWLIKAELIHYVRDNGAHDVVFFTCGGR